MSSLTSANLAVLDHFLSAESLSKSTYHQHHNPFSPSIGEPMKGCGACSTAASTRALHTKSIVFMPGLNSLIIDTHSASLQPHHYQQSNSAPTSPTRKPSFSSTASSSSSTSLNDPSEAGNCPTKTSQLFLH